MYRDTVTVFCRKGKCWYPYVLTDVDLNADRAAIIAQYGADSKDSAKLHIKYEGEGAIGSLSYCTPKEYAQKSDVSSFITFATGNEFSFFVHASMSSSAIDDEDYENGFYDYCRRTMDEVYCITSVAKYSVIPHFEILAR